MTLRVAYAIPLSLAVFTLPASATDAVGLAAGLIGKPYVWGAEGPRAFDCSGLTKWSYAKVGKRLSRTAQGQWKQTIHIKKSHRRAGDLVFFFHGRHAYHVAIYAGHGMIWHAPRPGKKVKKVKLWTSKVRYGRVR